MTVLWTRLEYGDTAYVELACEGNKQFVITGTIERRRVDVPTRTEIHEVASAAAAARGLEKRIATFKKKGYDFDKTFERAAPQHDSRGAAKAEREERWTEGRLTFEQRLPEFVQRWRALGFDPFQTFDAQSVRGGITRDHVAAKCLELATAVFGVAFSGRGRDVEAEHGFSRGFAVRQVAAFYRSPSFIAMLARLKLQGRLANHDGAFDFEDLGLHDEVVLLMRALPSSATTTR